MISNILDEIYFPDLSIFELTEWLNAQVLKSGTHGSKFCGWVKATRNKMKSKIFKLSWLFTQHQSFLKIARISIVDDTRETKNSQYLIMILRRSYVIPNKLDISIIMVIP